MYAAVAFETVRDAGCSTCIGEGHGRNATPGDSLRRQRRCMVRGAPQLHESRGRVRPRRSAGSTGSRRRSPPSRGRRRPRRTGTRRRSAHRLAPVEHLVAGPHQQEVALRPRDARHRKRGELVEMRRRHLERLAGVQVALRPEMRRERRRAAAPPGLIRTRARRNARRATSRRSRRASCRRTSSAARRRRSRRPTRTRRASPAPGRWCSVGQVDARRIGAAPPPRAASLRPLTARGDELKPCR